MHENNSSTEIHLFSNNQIDKKKWDCCISHSLNEIPYPYSWYLDCVCKNWEALIWKDYEAVFPLTWNKKGGVYYLFQPFFTQQLGVFSPKEISPSLLNDFLETIPEKFRLAEINLNIANPYSGNLFSVRKKITHQLLLNEKHDVLLANYNENTKRNLKKAAKENLTVTDDITAVQLISLFKKNQGETVKELKKEDYERLKNLVAVSIRNNSGELIGVKTINGKLCAAGFFVRSKRVLINLFPSSNEEGKKSGAMFLLIDYMLKKYEQSDLIFDFEGSEIPSIARFYKGFGAEEVYYYHIRRNNLPWHLKWLKQ